MRKPEKRRGISKKPQRRGRRQQYYKNFTYRMLESLWNIGRATSDLEPLKPVEKGPLRIIRERLIRNPDSWTPADYANVRKIFIKAFGKRAKPE